MFCDSLIHLSNIRIVFLQSLSSLQSEANLRLMINFPTVVLNVEKPVISDCK